MGGARAPIAEASASALRAQEFGYHGHRRTVVRVCLCLREAQPPTSPPITVPVMGAMLRGGRPRCRRWPRWPSRRLARARQWPRGGESVAPAAARDRNHGDRRGGCRSTLGSRPADRSPAAGPTLALCRRRPARSPTWVRVSGAQADPLVPATPCRAAATSAAGGALTDAAVVAAAAGGGGGGGGGRPRGGQQRACRRRQQRWLWGGAWCRREKTASYCRRAAAASRVRGMRCSRGRSSCWSRRHRSECHPSCL